VSRTFVARTKATLQELMARRLDDIRLAVLMIDGIDLKDRTNIVALGVSTEGVKIPLGLWEGSSENKLQLTDQPVRSTADDGAHRRAARGCGQIPRQGSVDIERD
jgi:hypothetical protein